MPGGTSGGSRAGPRHTHQAAPLGWGPVANLSPGGSPQARDAVRASAWPPPGTGRSALPAAAALSSFSWVPAMGLVTRRQCSRTENTVCVCDQGHFCVSESRDDCAECRPHTACRPGQRVQQRGERQTAGSRPPGPQHPLRDGPQTQARGGGKPSCPAGLIPCILSAWTCHFSGTEWQDRVCEDCPPETFSPSGTLEECQPWTR